MLLLYLHIMEGEDWYGTVALSNPIHLMNKICLKQTHTHTDSPRSAAVYVVMLVAAVVWLMRIYSEKSINVMVLIRPTSQSGDIYIWLEEAFSHSAKFSMLYELLIDVIRVTHKVINPTQESTSDCMNNLALWVPVETPVESPLTFLHWGLKCTWLLRLKNTI